MSRTFSSPNGTYFFLTAIESDLKQSRGLVRACGAKARTVSFRTRKQTGKDRIDTLKMTRLFLYYLFNKRRFNKTDENMKWMFYNGWLQKTAMGTVNGTVSCTYSTPHHIRGATLPDLLKVVVIIS